MAHRFLKYCNFWLAEKKAALLLAGRRNNLFPLEGCRPVETNSVQSAHTIERYQLAIDTLSQRRYENIEGVKDRLDAAASDFGEALGAQFFAYARHPKSSEQIRDLIVAHLSDRTSLPYVPSAQRSVLYGIGKHNDRALVIDAIGRGACIPASKRASIVQPFLEDHHLLALKFALPDEESIRSTWKRALRLHGEAQEAAALRCLQRVLLAKAYVKGPLSIDGLDRPAFFAEAWLLGIEVAAAAGARGLCARWTVNFLRRARNHVLPSRSQERLFQAGVRCLGDLAVEVGRRPAFQPNRDVTKATGACIELLGCARDLWQGLTELTDLAQPATAGRTDDSTVPAPASHGQQALARAYRPWADLEGRLPERLQASRWPRAPRAEDLISTLVDEGPYRKIRATNRELADFGPLPPACSVFMSAVLGHARQVSGSDGGRRALTLCGQPGEGKSTLAAVLTVHLQNEAKEQSAPRSIVAFELSMASMLQGTYSESAKALRHALDTLQKRAERDGLTVVLFVDDAERIFIQEQGLSSAATENRRVNREMLPWLDSSISGQNLFFIFTVNDFQLLPKALKSRLEPSLADWKAPAWVKSRTIEKGPLNLPVKGLLIHRDDYWRIQPTQDDGFDRCKELDCSLAQIAAPLFSDLTPRAISGLMEEAASSLQKEPRETGLCNFLVRSLGKQMAAMPAVANFIRYEENDQILRFSVVVPAAVNGAYYASANRPRQLLAWHATTTLLIAVFRENQDLQIQAFGALAPDRMGEDLKVSVLLGNLKSRGFLRGLALPDDTNDGQGVCFNTEAKVGLQWTWTSGMELAWTPKGKKDRGPFAAEVFVSWKQATQSVEVCRAKDQS